MRAHLLVSTLSLATALAACGTAPEAPAPPVVDPKCGEANAHVMACGLTPPKNFEKDCSGADEVLTLGCEELHEGYNANNAKADGFLWTLRSEGEPCTFNFQCGMPGSDLVCRPLWDSVLSLVAKSCQQPARFEQLCDDDSDCDDDSFTCRPNTNGAFAKCMPFGRIGDVCYAAEQCTGELACAQGPNGPACANPLPRNATCTSGACARNLVCRPTSSNLENTTATCTDKAAIGGRCLEDSDCKAGTFQVVDCENGTCRERDDD